MSQNSSKHSLAHHVKPIVAVWKWWFIIIVPVWVYISLTLAQIIIIALISLLKTLQVPLSDINPIVFNASSAAILYILTLSIVIGVPWLAKKYHISRETIGLHRLPSWGDIIITPVGFITYLILSAALTYVATVLFTGFNSTQPQDTGFNQLTTQFELILAFMTLVVVAPLAEEVIFRGFLFGTLRKFVPLWAAIFATSLLFGFVHGAWNLGIDTFALSVVMCVLRVRTGSLWPSILLHMTKNGIAFYVLYILH